MSQWGIVDGQLRRMKRELERKDAYTHFAQYDGQRAAVSCPPDTHLHIRGGWLNTAYGEQLPTPDLDLNFGLDPDGSYGLDGWFGPTPFSTAGYYRAGVVLRKNLWDDVSEQLGVDAQIIWTPQTPDCVSTAACAEQWGDWVLRYTLDSNFGYPLCLIIVRNDGVTSADDPGIYGHILPIDAVNRGRSYLWRDIRPVMYDPFRTTTIGAAPPAPTCT